jgi:hypothetical protein
VCADGKCAPAGGNAGCSHCDKILRARHNRNCKDFYLEDAQPVKRGRMPLHVVPYNVAQTFARGYESCCRAVASAQAFCSGLSKELSAVSKELSSAVVDDLLPPAVDVPPHGRKANKTVNKRPGPTTTTTTSAAGRKTFPSTKHSADGTSVHQRGRESRVQGPRVAGRPSTSVKAFSSGQPPAPATTPRGTKLQQQPGRDGNKNKRAATERSTSKQTVQCLVNSNPHAVLRATGDARAPHKKEEKRQEKKRSGWGVLDFLNLVPKDKAPKRSPPKPQPKPAPPRKQHLVDIRLPDGQVIPQQRVSKSMRRALEAAEVAEAKARREEEDRKERLRRRAAERKRAQAEKRSMEEEARRQRTTSADPFDRRARWAVNSAVNDAFRNESRGRKNDPEVIAAAIRSVPPGARHSP